MKKMVSIKYLERNTYIDYFERPYKQQLEKVQYTDFHVPVSIKYGTFLKCKLKNVVQTSRHGHVCLVVSIGVFRPVLVVLFYASHSPPD